MIPNEGLGYITTSFVRIPPSFRYLSRSTNMNRALFSILLLLSLNMYPSWAVPDGSNGAFRGRHHEHSLIESAASPPATDYSSSQGEEWHSAEHEEQNCDLWTDDDTSGCIPRVADESCPICLGSLDFRTSTPSYDALQKALSQTIKQRYHIPTKQDVAKAIGKRLIGGLVGLCVLHPLRPFLYNRIHKPVYRIALPAQCVDGVLNSVFHGPADASLMETVGHFLNLKVRVCGTLDNIECLADHYLDYRPFN